MKDVLRLLTHLLECSFVCSLLIGIPLVAFAQTNGDTVPSQNFPISVSLEKDSAGNADQAVQKGFISVTITNYLPESVGVSIIWNQSGNTYFSADLAPNPVKCSHHPLMSTAYVRLPAKEYTLKVSRINAFGFRTVNNTADIEGISTHGYNVTLGLEPTMLCPSEGESGGASPVPAPSQGTVHTTISSQIDRIAGGAHQDLPPPSQTSLAPGQRSGWSIENATGYELHLYLSGPVEHSYVIANGSSVAVDLPAGSYRIAADVGHGVLPFYAVRQLGDARWKSQFYLSQQRN